jgi:N-terminal half of MaoC dehydratase
MRMDREGFEYPPYRLRADRGLAAAYLEAQGDGGDLSEVPPTYMIFLRGEARGLDLFADLGIPRQRALHGGQRYEWFAPIGWDRDLDVTAKVAKITEKASKGGPLWFANIEYEYRFADSGQLALREVTRIIERG